jgi:hypothetical protein
MGVREHHHHVPLLFVTRHVGASAQVTPDGQRTMRTFLGAAGELRRGAQLPVHVLDGSAANLSLLHCEGYCLYRPEVAAAAMQVGGQWVGGWGARAGGAAIAEMTRGGEFGGAHKEQGVRTSTPGRHGKPNQLSEFRSSFSFLNSIHVPYLSYIRRNEGDT